jgi:hypothetical protein
MNRFIGHSQGVNTNIYTTLKITVTITHKVKSSSLLALLMLGNESYLVNNAQLNLPIFKVKVILRLTVSHSVSFGVEPHLGLMTKYLLLFDSYGLVFVGRLL